MSPVTSWSISQARNHDMAVKPGNWRQRAVIVMKYYSEDDMKNLRLAFEEKALCWSQAGTKKMFGCPCYQVNGKLFAFLVTNGIVITQLDLADSQELSSQRPTTFFQAGKKIVRSWIRTPIKNKRDIDEIMPFVRKSYECAFRKE